MISQLKPNKTTFCTTDFFCRKITEFNQQNSFLGVTEEINLREQKEWIALPERALIFIHTDGLYELEPLASTYGGFKKSLSFLEIRIEHSDVAIHESVEALVNLQHGKALEDDVTVMTLQLNSWLWSLVNTFNIII